MNNITKAVVYVQHTNCCEVHQKRSLRLQLDILTVLARELKLEIVKVLKQTGVESDQLENALNYVQANKDVGYLLVTDLLRFSPEPQEAINWQVMFENEDVEVLYL